MRETVVIDHLASSEIKNRMLESSSRQQFQRWQVIYMMGIKGFKAEDAADIAGVSTGTVYQWVHAYNHKGPEAMDLQGRGGRRKSLLSWEEEEAILEKLSKQAKKGELIIAAKVKEFIEQKLGYSVSKDYPYDSQG